MRYSCGMTLDEARKAARTLEDVFTADGDAGVIQHISKQSGEVFLTGPALHRWVALDELTPLTGAEVTR